MYERPFAYGAQSCLVKSRPATAQACLSHAPRGGYKLGGGEKAAIRFSASALPTHGATSAQRPRTGTGSNPTRRHSRAGRHPRLRGAPRLPVRLGDDG